MKAYKFVAIGICALLLLPACGTAEPVQPESGAESGDSTEQESVRVSGGEGRKVYEPEDVSEAEKDRMDQNSVSETPDESLLFARMPEYFVFSSGAGAWSTELELEDDGSFSGVYHDSEMGLTGEDYPNGTVYICRFSGRFSEPEQTDFYTWTVQVEKLQTEGIEGRETFEDGIRYVEAEPYGLAEKEELQIFMPGTPVEQLPAGFLSWTAMYFDPETEHAIPFYGIYDAENETAFIGMED